MRVSTYSLILFLSLCVLALGLFFVQVVSGGRFYELSLRNTIRLIPEEPYRGRIFDRYGNLMADNILSFDAVIIPQELKDKEAVFKRLGEALGIDETLVAKKYERGYLNPFTPVCIQPGINKDMAITLEEKKFDLKGIAVDLNSRRFYPNGSSASHVLGYIGEIDKSRISRLKEYGYDLKDKMGYSGLEEKLDIFLRGEKGGQQIEVDNRGRQVRLLGYRPPQIGKDVQLTIDLEMQRISDQLLFGKKGAIVIMDVHTGDIVVLSSAPAFDPNVFVDRKDKKALNYFLGSEDAPLLNRAANGQFPPGSVFKIVTAAAALKTKKVSARTTYVCTGSLKVGNRYFKCWAEHGPQDFYQAMAHSCDVYFYHIGITAGADLLANTSHEFGFGSFTGIDLPQESQGFIPSRLWKRISRFENWYDGDTVNFSIGQGYVLTTPLQLTRMMAIVANGGYLVVPRLTRAIAGVDIPLKESKKIKIPKEYLDLIRKALREPVLQETGTAHSLDVQGLDICAKTGTAQVRGKESHAWVAGFFPENDPKYAFCILLENSGSSHNACALGKVLFEEAKKREKLS